MTDPNRALIGLVVDRSGSMSSCASDMEGGMATFLKMQADEDSNTKATLAQFDTKYELVYPPTPIEDVPKYHLIPRGRTALLDAVGRFITDVGQALADQPERKRPGKVIIVIVTDGMENASQEWTRHAVRDLIAKQKNQYNWEFVFLGANMDAVKEAAAFGIQRSSAMTFDTANVSRVMGQSLSNYVTSYNAVGAAAFSDEDRKEAMELGTSTSNK